MLRWWREYLNHLGSLKGFRPYLAPADESQ
jgi:hypothetical protein